MLKFKKNFKSSDFANHSSIESTNFEVHAQFIGYKPVKRGYVFRSRAEKYYPWRRMPPPEEWIRGSTNELTIRWRSEFQTFIDSTNDFKFYQLFPVKIPYKKENGKQVNYEPLALLTFWDDHLSPRNRASLLIDVRSNNEIKENFHDLFPAFRAAHRFSQRRKLRFRIFRDKFFLSDYFANLSYMKQYCVSNINYSSQKLIEDTLYSIGASKIRDLIDILSETQKETNSEQLTHDIWSLVQQGWINTNWNLPFDQNTIIWV